MLAAVGVMQKICTKSAYITGVPMAKSVTVSFFDNMQVFHFSN